MHSSHMINFPGDINTHIITFVCVFVCVCVLCQRYKPFGHKIFFSLAVSVSLRRLLLEV